MRAVLLMTVNKLNAWQTLTPSLSQRERGLYSVPNMFLKALSYMTIIACASSVVAGEPSFTPSLGAELRYFPQDAGCPDFVSHHRR